MNQNKLNYVHVHRIPTIESIRKKNSLLEQKS